MKKFLGLMLTLTIASSVGCAGPGSNTVAGNVATGATINAVAGVPGAGLVGAAAMAVEALSKPSSPKGGKASPALAKMVQESPTCNLFCKQWKERVCKEEELEVFWRSRKKEDGSFVTVENAPKRSMEYTEAFRRATFKYMSGILGDTPEMQTRNLKAREEGRSVVAEYYRPNNANLVFVSTNKDEVADAMLAEEWAAKNAGGATDISGSTVNSGSDTEANGKN